MVEFAGGSFVFLAVEIVLFAGVIVALFTRKGSGMNHHPYRHPYGGAPAADMPCVDYSGSDRTSVTERDVAQLWRRRRRAQDPAAIAAWVEEARARRRQRPPAATLRGPE